MIECLIRLAPTRLEYWNLVLRICFGFLSRFTLPLLIVAVLGCCGTSGPKKYDVSGEVTWNGAPLSEGDILFEPIDGGVPDHGKITDGKFDFQATEGEKKVSIMATKAAADVDPEMGMAPQVNYIPLRYNAQSKLTANVTPDSENRYTFSLVEQE